MTQIVSLRTSAPMVLGAAVIAAGTLLAGAPSAIAEPSTDAVKAIDDRYTVFGGETSLLGTPTGEAVDVPGGAERDYQGGVIYYSKDSGAHVMYGDILERYRALGGPAGSGLGFPKNDESDTGDGTGRFNDFTAPGGASIYWTPQWGASVVKGRVLEAWRQSGGITGPFGYPSADTSVIDGVQTGKFAGPEGTEIQWSEAGGLITVPPELAGKLPGFGATTPATTTAEGTTAVSTPSRTDSEPTESGSKKWWWIPVGIGVLALLGLLPRLFRRRPEPEPVRVQTTRTPEVRKPAPAPVAKPVPPPPVVKAPAPPVVKAPPPAPKPPAPKPPTPVPPRVAPVVRAPEPPKPVIPPAPRPVPRPVVVPEPPRVVHTEPRVVHTEPRVVHTEPRVVHTEPVVHTETVVHTESVVHTTEVQHDVAPLIRYETHTPTETTVQVTYENNALGDNQESRADKSDATPD